jgi:hypothetical protein
LRAESPRSCRAVEPEVRLSRSFALPLYSTPVNPSLSKGSAMLQSSNAANPGDQLKHGLLAELLSRCVDWPSLTYAETHAGAGI